MLSRLRAGGIELLAAPRMAAMEGAAGEVVSEAIGKAGIMPMKRI